MDKNFMVRIMANIRDFQNNVRKAQTLAKTSIPDEIETDVKANISKFQRNLQRAKAMAQRWREHKVEIDGDTNPIKRAISFAKAELQRLRDKQVDIKGDNDNLKRAVISAKVMLASLHDKTVHVNFDTRGMTRAQVLTKALGKSLDEYGNKMDALATKIRTFGTVFSQQVRGLMIASIQGLIPVIAGLVPALMAVLNAVGVLAGGILGLAGAFSIAGAGAFAFGGMAISALKMLKDGTLQATAETRRYQASLDQVKSTWESIIKQNQAQIFNTLANGLNTVNVALSRMKPFLAGVSKGMEQASKSVLKWAENSQTASKFFNMMNTTGVKTFNTLLSAAGHFGDGLVNVFTQLGPLFLWVAQGLDSLGKKFQNWANSVAGQNAIKAFIEYTKTNLPKIGQIFGNVFAGIGNLMVAFAQNSAVIFDWLVKMTGKFREWSEQVGKSEGFKQFVEYVQQNGPVIMQLIGNIVRALVAFGTAMAPIASVILRVVTAFTGFIAKLFETHPAVAKMVGIGMILAGIMWALLAPIIAVGTVLSNVFGVSLLQAIGKIARFMASSNILKGVLNILRGAFSLLVSPIANIGRLLPLLGTAFSALTGPVGIVIGVILALVGVIVYLWKTNEDFRNMIINAWNGIKDAVSGAISSIVGWFAQLWASIQQTLQPIMPILQQLGQMFMNVLGGLVMGAIQLVIGAFQSLWLAVSVVFTAIGAIISSVIQLIVGLFTAFIQLLTGDFSGAWLTLQTTIQNVMMTIWNAIVSIWTQISQFIFTSLNSILGMNITSWSQIWSAIVQYVTQIWNSVTQWFGQMAQSVWNKMVQAYNYVVSTGAQWVSSIISTLARFVSSVISGFIRVVSSVASYMAQALSRVISVGAQWVSAIIGAMARFVSGVISGFVNVVSQVQSGMSRAVNTVRNFIGQFVSAGLDLMRGLVQGIMNGMKWVVNAAKNVAQSAVNAAKSALGIHSPSRVFRGIGQYVSQGLGMGILADQHKAVNAVRSVASNLTDAFKPELSTDLTDGLGGSLNGSVDAHMTKDVRHSMQENNRPIVNITVRNEGDVEYIKSYIEEQNGKNSSMGL
ncbi:terminase [Staphylococcus haemolyticus]|uniref:phage tail protein n=1 Tax=Staphylococcus haemolyticus TaxID=1283 RepID=UPI0018C8472B|nr:terminase [Staphylococcus haemolyticus]